MVTETKSATLQERSFSPIMLAKRAKSEIRTNGKTAIICPRCNTVPEITMTPKGERTIVSCQCGYVHDVDINF
jgi:transcription elongation factor Elf1